jgi:hypothetical protein
LYSLILLFTNLF